MDVVDAVRQLLEQIVRGVPGVRGAMVASVDGFSLGHSIAVDPASPVPPTDPAALAAMTASILGIANRMTGAVGPAPVAETTMSSPDGHVVVIRIGDVAALTVLARTTTDVMRVRLVSRELVPAIERVIRSLTPTDPGTTGTGTTETRTSRR
jgi:uncharacterized protein